MSNSEGWEPWSVGSCRSVVVGAGIVWPSARSTVLKKFMSGERDAVVAAAEEPELPECAVLFDAVVLFARVGDEPNLTPGAVRGLYRHSRHSRSQLEQLGFASSHRTLRDLHVRHPVRRRGPDLPAPRAFGT